MISPTSVHAYQGLERAFADAARASETFVSSLAAREVGASARSGLRSDQTVRAAVDLAKAKLAAKASARAMRAGDKLAGSLLDILV